MGCTVADVPAQQPVEHLKNALQNITTDRTSQSVQDGPTEPEHLGAL